MKKPQLILSLAVAAGLAFVITPARASTVIFHARSLWESGLASELTLDFTSDFLVSPQTNYTSGGLTDSGIHFSSTELYVLPGGDDDSPGASVMLYDGSGLLTVTLPADTTALGLNLFSVTGANNNIGITAFLADSTTTGDSYVAPAFTNTGTFWGITSDVAISSLTISTSQGWLGVDHFSVGTVPEPTSVMLFLFGSAVCLRRCRLRTHERNG